MKIGITGANGFIGWHLRCYLKTRNDVEEVRLAGRDVFQSHEKLVEFVDGVDAIVHLAGVNRAEPKELVEGNAEPAAQLVQALEQVGNKPFLVYTTSTQAVTASNPYGEGKAAVSKTFQTWATNSDARFVNFIVPHVFGEYGRPNYNSVVATFTHQIAAGEVPSVHNDGQLELVHVQDLVEQIINLYEQGASGDVRVEGRATGVIEVAEQLKLLHHTYVDEGQFPDLSDHFTRCLFNTLRGAIAHSERHRVVTKHEDDRGWLIETVKANSGGQCFVSTTKPGITRGNHFHKRKVERFFILQGKAQVKLRKLFTDDVIVYELDGAVPSFVDIPTLHTHNITNTGKGELVTLFWSDESFDPNNSDTYFEEV
jgi:UDP-2-acetamido-2,6-beta-L-arabino-hexul-4-ose reductase